MKRIVSACTRYISKKTTQTKWHLRIAGVTLLTVGVVIGSYITLSNLILRVFASNTTYPWDFSVPATYTVSDSTLAEVTGGKARLKLREYSSDGSTALLLHLNESAGNPSDSSSNSHTATGTSLTFGSGKMNNGATFNGTSSFVSVDDSSSLSLTSNHTIESWVNFSDNFSATTHGERQTIVDKGTYQLYFDHDNGKLTYELEPATTKTWTQMAGPNLAAGNGQSVNTTWDLNGKTNIYGQVKIGSAWYVAIGSATGANDAEVWRCTGCDGSTPTWTKVGGDSVYSSWAIDTYEYVGSIATDGTVLYVGLSGTGAGDGEVWRCSSCDSSPTWTRVGGDGANSSWANSTYEAVPAMVMSGTTLYVGLGISAGDAEVYRCTGCDGGTPTWTRIGGDAVSSSWANSTYEQVRSLAIVGSNLVAGLGDTAGDGEVWSTDTSSISWTKRGGDGTASGGQSWGSAYEQVNALAGSGNYLFVGLGTGTGEAEVWRCDLSSSCSATAGWTQIGGDGLNSSFNTNYETVRSFAVSGTTVYVGIGDGGGDAEVWRCTSCTGTPTWAQLAGDGNGIQPQSWGSTHTQVSTLMLDGTILYTGVSSTSWSSEYWRCDTGGTCSNTAGWTRLGGSYANRSWETVGLYSAQEIAEGDGKVYVGNGNTQAGNALVWEYDIATTNWTLIGGASITSSWENNQFESVDSMLYYKGNLYVGLGRSTNDAEVWRWNGTVWTKVGGDGTGSSWNLSYENVSSLAVYNGELYAGLGNNANGDAEVYSCSGCDGETPSWTKRGGDGTNSGWLTGTFREVPAMVTHAGFLYAGIAGSSAGDAEVWRWNGTAWTRVGGDGNYGGWANTVYERVDSLSVFNNKIVAGLGNTAGDAEVWQCTSCDGDSPSWGGTRIGGDDTNGTGPYGWLDSTYEQVLDMAVFNANLYVALGVSAAESEVWRYDGSNWTKVGGDGANSGWTNVINYVQALATANGQLWAGTGGDTNSDATVWAYGGNFVARSAALSWTAGDWHHIAATYNGTQMKLYVDGVQSGSTTSATLTLADTNVPLLIGVSYGTRGNIQAPGWLDGTLDELHIYPTERTSFVTTPYSASPQTIQPTTAVYTAGIKNFDAFSVTDNGVGTLTYRLSSDGGSTWKYYSGGAWATSASTSQANDEATINTNMSTFPVGTGGILWQAILVGNGDQQPTITEVIVGGIADITDPENPSSLTSLSSSSGTAILTETWNAHTAPYFSWSGATDTGGSGIAGYYVYFGTDSGILPSDSESRFQAGNTYTAASLVSGSTYYLRIQAKDNAGNTQDTVWQPFIYKFDSSAPTNPTAVSVSPAGYASTNAFTFSWPAGTANGSPLAGYQYKTGASLGALSDWSTTTSATSVAIDDAAYQTGENVFYLRTLDQAGNTSASIQVSYYYGGDGPSAPQFVSVSPSSNTTNSFAISWQAPQTHSGPASTLTYCYTFNTLPSANTCTFTSAGATSLAASSFATQVGLNTVYIVAKNGSDYGSSINYGNYASATFTANTSAPGIPLNADIADVSVKSTSSWKLALSWEAPSDTGSGVATYEIYRSTDDSSYAKIAETSGIAYVDTSLSQTTYYYKVRACDNVDNCGSYSSSVSMLPTGKYTDAAGLTSGPTVSSITTKQATISWGTDREADSKIQFGTGAGSYLASEPSNSTQTKDHIITLTNLSPGTTYFFKAKWTDEDGNTGKSNEKTFTTEPSPTIKDVSVKNISLASGIVQFTSKGASKVKIYYGETTAFGGVLTVSTSTSETTYTAQLEDLNDGTKYYYKVNAFDSENAEYEGTILNFTTLPRPKISTVRIQQVRNTAQPTVLVTWKTNTPTSSIITYYPEGKPDQAKDEVNVNLQDGDHRLLIRGLSPETPYVLVVKGRDKAGNEASSEPTKLTTATDTRPASISNLKVEGSVQTASEDSSQALAQLVISWTTDEPTTSQVEYGEGTGTTYAQKTQEDSSLTVNHMVVITGLSPSKVYHLRALSKDKASNLAQSIDTVTITPKATDNALNLVISNLQQVFGFLGALQTQ